MELITLDLLEQLEEIVLESTRLPFSGSRLVNEQEAIDLILRLRKVLPSEIRKAQEILKASDELIEKANSHSNKIIKEAKHTQSEMINNSTLKKY